MSNEVKAAKKRIDDILDQQARERAEVESSLKKMQDVMDDLHDQLDEAAKEMNAKRYEELTEQIHKQETVIKMYEAKSQILKRQPDIPDDESDALLDGLVKYVCDREAAYTSKIESLTNQIRKVHEEHQQEIQEAEALMNKWQNYIHPKYKGSDEPAFTRIYKKYDAIIEQFLRKLKAKKDIDASIGKS